MPQDPALLAAWRAVHDAAARPGGRGIARLFAADPDRAARHTAALDDLTLDLSKTAIDDVARAALLGLADAAGLADFRTRLFAGAAVNVTEGRAAMHMALRTPGLRALDEDASGIAAAELARMADFVARVHAGTLRSATGETFTHVLNIGIGGSDLGPRMVTEALTMAGPRQMEARFLSNVDGHSFAGLSRDLDPARTLILVASKTFTTLETMTNAGAARDWLTAALGPEAVGQHFVALSTNAGAVSAFGIAAERMFGFRDWVGGRYSVWSPVGLSVALAAGWPAFQALLAGAAAMDAHFRSTPFEANLPVLLALAGIWHVNAMGYPSHCVLAYDDRLKRFPAYLQQLEMESNGKSVGLDGLPVAQSTAPALFGEPGTDAQHSFMQLVHQGTNVIPVDFIMAASPDHSRADAHDILLANALAQAQALLAGRTLADVLAEGTDPAIAPHRVFSGDRPSITILFRRLDAFSLGRLIALYEHKVAVQGCIWGINSFDQWGVELGKVLAGGVLAQLRAPGAGTGDGSTEALLARIHDLRAG